MTLALDRGLALLERLCGEPEGMPLTALADELDIPRSACDRLLAERQRRGYVRQSRSQGDYVLTAKLASLDRGFLSSSGIVDIAAAPRAAREGVGRAAPAWRSSTASAHLGGQGAGHARRAALRPRHGHGRAPVSFDGPCLAADAERRTGAELVSRQGFGQAQGHRPRRRPR